MRWSRQYLASRYVSSLGLRLKPFMVHAGSRILYGKKVQTPDSKYI